MVVRNTRTATALILVAAALFSGYVFANLDNALQREADQAIDGLEKLGYSGSVLVSRGDDLVYFRDSGVEDTATCVPSYWIASITKQFTAVGILLLHERNVLNIGDSISAYLPDVPADKSGITLFHLLTHTSGLQQQYAADGIIDREAAQNALLAAELKTKPGVQFSYANDNYNLLAMIIETASGATYEEFLGSEILAPIGMHNSGFWGMAVESGTCVPPVATQPEPQIVNANWGFRGATGMRASVEDLHAFMQALQRHETLSKESTNMLMGSHLTLSSGTEVGFNWFAQERDHGQRVRFSRGQESFGGNAVIYDYPDRGLTIITATNAGPAETGEGPVAGWSRKTHQAMADVFIAE
jgi:CubicO group peptidase (beta-lactamase class C family)